MNKLRFGILSTGNIARQFAAGVRASERCVLQAVGSRTLESAGAFASAQQAPQAHGSYDALVADPQVDAIYIGLPNTLHREWTIKSLRAGKHVLCEKPLASNREEAREMFAAAHASGRLLVEAFMYRAHPQTLRLLETIRSGRIGELRMIRSSFCYKTTRIAGNIRSQPELAGGALMDIGCYCLDFSQLVVGEAPVKISACARLHESGVDEIAAGVMQFRTGIVATFTCGMTAAANNAAHVCGADGYIEIPVPWKPQPGNAQFTIAQGIPPKMDAVAAASLSSGPQTIRVDAPLDVYAYEADAFAAAVAGERPVHMPEAATLSNLRLLDELRREVGVLR